MSAGLGFSCRGMLIWVALVSGCVAAARANVLDDIGDFFSGNAPEVASSQDCEFYAQGAMRQAQLAQQYACPLGGDRYGTYEKGHYGWCMGVTHETSNVEASIREREVATCMSLSTQTYCGSYGETAAKDAQDNKPSQNGWGRWDTGYGPHFSWCIRSGPWNVPTTARAKTAMDTANAENEIRNAAVQACLAPLKSAVTGGGKKPTLVVAPTTSRDDGSWKPKPVVVAPVNSSGAYPSKKPVGNSAMDRLGGGGGPSVGGSSGVSTSSTTRPGPRPSVGGSSSGVNLSAPISPPSRGSSSGVNLSAPISPPSGGSSSGVNLSAPISPPSGGSSSGVNLSKPGR
jgi:hypothetical protein